MGRFADILMEWYGRHGRDLPWRHTKDPYRIWVSEIILQQTRVMQGYEYYCRFIKRFPDVGSLAKASEEEVMRHWQGLGYYSRARNLHAAAKSILMQGRFPVGYDEVRALKGVGDYTAAAICSFAYDMPCAVVDGNVYRVLSRWRGIEEPVDSSKGKKIFAALAGELIDRQRPALYNQAIMDFGALQCVPSSPDCMACPLAETCVAFHSGKVGVLPCKQHKTKVSCRYLIYLYVHTESGDMFVRKREKADIWQNLYEIPLLEEERAVDEEELFCLPGFAEMFARSAPVRVRLVRKDERHVLSHRVIFADFYEVVVPDDAALPGYLRIREGDLYKFPVSRLLSRFFSLLLKPD